MSAKNLSRKRISLELLDGLPAVIPYGVDYALLKGILRTIEAWMGVFNFERQAPFFRLRVDAGDSALGRCRVEYRNPLRQNTFDPGMSIRNLRFQTEDGRPVEIAGDVIGTPFAALGRIRSIDAFY